jgi:adenylate cyclase
MADAGVLKLGRRLTWLLRRLPILVPIVVLAAGIFLNFSQPTFIQRLTSFSFDSLQRLKPRPYTADMPVRIVDIDDPSLEKLGQWPWPRTLMAELVGKLAESGAAVIAFDGMLAEPDRTSPPVVASQIPAIAADPVLRERLSSLPDNDHVLASVIKQIPMVLGFTPTEKNTDRLPPRPSGTPAISGNDPASLLRGWQGTITNIDVLDRAATGIGSITTDFALDNTIRGVPLFFKIRNELYPSLAAETLRVVQPETRNRSYVIKTASGSGETDFGEGTAIVTVRIGQIEVQTDRGGQVLLYDTGPKAERILSAADVLAPDFDPAGVADMVVFIGSSAAGIKDLRVTPLDPVAPGVVVHAQIVEQMLTGTYLQRPDWIPGAERIFLILMGLLMIFLLARLSAAWAGAVALVFICSALAASWFGFSELGWLIDPVYPSGVLLVMFLSGTLFSYIRSEAERRQVRDAFSLYLAPELVKEVAADPDRLKLGGEQREVTVMFTDIRRFTTISESLKPDELTRFLNGFLTPMTDIIQSRRGTIDKYMGDAIMAFWNAPLDDADHAGNACRAALEMRARLVEVNAAWQADHGEGSPLIEIGIGLNTGPAAVGNFGSARRMAYSVIGDAVNLSSRLEGQTKAYGADTLISEETQKRAPDFAVVELDLLRVKGKREPSRIFALMGDQNRRLDAGFAALADAQARFLEAYRAGRFAEATALLDEAEAAANAFGWHQHYYEVMRLRMARLIAEPPVQWDGVYEATEK